MHTMTKELNYIKNILNNLIYDGKEESSELNYFDNNWVCMFKLKRNRTQALYSNWQNFFLMMI